MKYDIRKNCHGEIIIHRTWVKMIVNPILRIFGYQFTSVFCDDKFVKYSLRKVSESCRRI